LSAVMKGDSLVRGENMLSPGLESEMVLKGRMARTLTRRLGWVA